MGKFQKEVEALRRKMALESAETVARLNCVESTLTAKIEGLEAAMKTGFAEMEMALVAQAERNLANFDTLVELVSNAEEQDQAWKTQVEHRLAQLERREAS